MAYDNTNSGALFKNDRKETDNHPDYTGKLNVEGADYWMSAWIKTSSKDGRKFMSISIKKVEAKRASAPAPAAPAGEPDDVPF